MNTELMPTRPLGDTGLSVSAIGFGAWAAGGSGWEVSLGPQDDGDTISAIRRAADAGVNWIDTAPVYGLGHSEEVIGRALRTFGDSRPLIFTKCSIRWHPDGTLYHDQTTASIREEITASLRRLRVDRIDACFIHWPIPIDDLAEGWATLSAVREEGLVRCIGLSNFDVHQVRSMETIASVDLVQPRYSLLSREIESDLLPYCHERGIGVVVYSPMAMGLLGGSITRERLSRMDPSDWRRGHPEFQEPLITRNLSVVDKVRTIADRHGCTTAEVAIAWVLHNPAVSGAIVGLRSVAQVEGCISSASVRLSESDLQELNSITADLRWTDE